ncbi:hypothetical protein GCM10011391_26600 [Pullulanibacillus camelliae]|uniref:Flagellar protein FlbD n=1 Tax=Pullulanibacillus camelliae TaxID=1707096 RepID=A0A8J2YJA8_9BACL|nr:flagellar FlbD family protein [Pullulanibacillus camelliae]GGE46476.1 hypothetical protein GCM10011391_26600 [Pullulanibacillus camelliae]
MIQLTRINGKAFTLNALLIEQVEALPDTTISLTTGKKIIVKDTEYEVTKKTRAFYKEIGLFASNMTEKGAQDV